MSLNVNLCVTLTTVTQSRVPGITKELKANEKYD